jgi:hypothetical protein
LFVNPLFLPDPGFFDHPHQETNKAKDYYTKQYPQPNGASTSGIQIVVDALSVHVVDDDVVHFVYLSLSLCLNYNTQ